MGLPSLRKSKRTGASRESTSRDRLHVCGQANACTSPLPQTSGLLSFWCFFLPFFFSVFFFLASHVMHPGQDARLAARAGGRQGSLHIFWLIAGSQWNVCEIKTMAQACRRSQSGRGPSQSVLNGLHQCVIAITRSSQGPRQDELYFMALQQIFFFLFSSNLNPFFLFFFLSHCYVAWSECGIVFAFELPHKQFICFFSFREHLLLISELSGWLRNHGDVCVFMLCKRYFRLILARL